MNSQTAEMLLEEVAPRLTNLLRSVIPVGVEDSQELLQDGIAMAAQLLDRCYQAGKSVTPGNIAYYVTLSLKQGRRSTGFKATDAMGPATQLRGRSATVSIDQPLEGAWQESMTLADMLADDQEDPATAALRNLDWEELAESSTSREMAVAAALTQGYQLKETAQAYGVSPSSFNTARNSLAQRIREEWGPDILVDSGRDPAWMANLNTERERRACRHKTHET